MPAVNHPSGYRHYAETDLRHQILRDAVANGHDPAPWASDAGRLTTTCSLCGEDAIIATGDCQIDNLQDACRADDLYREAAQPSAASAERPRRGDITPAQQRDWLQAEQAAQAELAPWLDAMPAWVWELLLRARNALATPNPDAAKTRQVSHEIDQLLGTRLGADDGVTFNPDEFAAATTPAPPDITDLLESRLRALGVPDDTVRDLIQQGNRGGRQAAAAARAASQQP